MEEVKSSIVVNILWQEAPDSQHLGGGRVSGNDRVNAFVSTASMALPSAAVSGVSKAAPIANVATKGGMQIGQSFGKLGTVVENPGLSIANFSKHGLNQAITRGANPSAILKTVKNPVTVLQQSGGNYLYLTKEAAVVINPAGRVVSTYPAAMFDNSILNVLKGF